ncbi:MAG TPA: MBL fold metallo-hydrolase [Edaphobacter sp.]|uniref:ComEC/Rec2 family competence protein n=1 Tax=Edaphobacter sp. TaxID=1934404 RepID=UPI002CCC1386|nr:MBL fold metallo-hydrolase [Edaphobacter sp.]HUZ94170.1 MBL fold metallo-hydrolase [Edaphobacter sp.]
MNRLLAAALLMATPLAFAQKKSSDLKVYFADVEGGQATLFVPSSGENLMVDAGWPGAANADKLVALAKIAGVSKIDNFVITHYHIDHVGGVPELAAKIPVGRFIDHGINRETDDKVTETSYQNYQKMLANGHYAHLTAKPGEILPLTGIHVEVVSADGNVIEKPLAGAGATNSACAASIEKPAENTENDRSVGMMITFGKLRIADLGDLTWNKERMLMCPVNKLGKVDVYIVSHHGFDRSSSPALLNGIAPRVAIMDNGATKGAEAGAWDIVDHSPRLKDLWQLHTAIHTDAAHNSNDSRIANLAGTDAFHYLVLTVHPSGTFAVTNSRTNQTVEYPAH